MADEPPPDIKSAQPEMTPQFCFNTTALRDFLRLSRSTLDDSISAHLNSLLTPSTAGFVPSSTTRRSIRTRPHLPPAVAAAFKRDILFPSWQARSNVLTYCRGVADAPDPGLVAKPEPPPMNAQEQDTEAPPPKKHQVGPSDLWETPPRKAITTPLSRNYWGKEQVVDERTDPYSGKDYSYTWEGRQQMLAEVLQNEEVVEGIVRARTWGVIADRCGGDAAEGGWKAELERWRGEQGLR